MSTLAELAEAAQSVVAAVRDVFDDPGDQVKALLELAESSESLSTGEAVPDAVGALLRRAALAGAARAAADALPPSYDEAVALRDRLCGAIDAEVIRAGDAGNDASCEALRQLSTAVAEDITARAANLPALRDVATPAPMPALVQAYRLYGDISRANELAAYAAAEDPNFLPTQYRALAR